MREIDIAIIGGGPCGSAACYALQTVLGESLKVQIFERATQLLPVGGIIAMFSENFTKACNAIQAGLFEELSGVSFIRKSFKRFDQFGNFEEEMQREGFTTYILPWYKIQQFFMGKLLPNSVNLDSKISNLIEVQDGVLLTFQNGEQVKAKLVLGADGNYSQTRMLLFDEKAPAYSGACVWRLQCKGVYKYLQPDNCNVYIGFQKLLSGQCTPCHLDNQNGEKYRTYVTGISNWPENPLHELINVRYYGPQNKTADSQKIIERFEKQFSDFPKDFIQWIKEHIDTDLSLEHAMYARDPQAPWGKGRVSLMGDAAHVMPPNGAQGLPQALEDAVEIAHTVSQFGITQEALREYEKRRIERLLPMQEQVITNQQSFYVKGDMTSNPFNRKEEEIAVIKKLIKEYNPKPIKKGLTVRAQFQLKDFKAEHIGTFNKKFPLNRVAQRFVVR